MSFQQKVFDVIQSLTGEKNLLVIPKIFVELIGDLESALFLSQLIYWSDKTRNKDGYVYKTYQEWEEEILLNEYKIRKAKKKLEKLGILQTKVKKADGNPTVHYKIDRKALADWFLKNLQKRTCENYRNQPVKIKESITETTTEITNINYKYNCALSNEKCTFSFITSKEDNISNHHKDSLSAKEKASSFAAF